ncbi:MAG: glutathione S-transferase N-terminal domain-containing protein [Deltaproteobacteria bacterium]|nr:glutathione S-transferase N-terminal domain-containing protein [Deltaproteobacteria bacterium]
MIDLYTWSTPNGRKVSILLEELGVPYEVHAVNIAKDEQLGPAFLRINPNNKIPAIVDRRTTSGDGVSPFKGATVFESGAILAYLCDTTPGGEKFYPSSSSSPAERAEVLQWLFWQVAGVGPMFGRAGRFLKETQHDAAWVADEFLDEVMRLSRVMDGQLERHNGMLASTGYSIADMACYPWLAGAGALVIKHRPAFGSLKHLSAWIEVVGARPAVQRGMAIPAPPA